MQSVLQTIRFFVPSPLCLCVSVVQSLRVLGFGSAQSVLKDHDWASRRLDTLLLLSYGRLLICRERSRRKRSASGRVKTLSVAPIARTQLAPRALPQRRQPSGSSPARRPAM